MGGCFPSPPLETHEDVADENRQLNPLKHLAF